MIAGSFGPCPAISARDHGFRTESVSDDETKPRPRAERACGHCHLWQTDSVTFGRIIIGWRVGT
jgi:hypothetical protein